MEDPCLDIEPLVALVEDRVTDAERALIEAHASRCNACRELLSALARSGAPPDEPARVLEVNRAPERVGRYVIDHELGAGGMGVVYAARDPLASAGPGRVAETAAADAWLADHPAPR